MTYDLPALPDPGDGLATLAEAFTIATTWHAQSGSSLVAAIDARNANRPTVAAAHYIAACCCMIVAQTARSVAAQIDPQRGDAEGGVCPATLDFLEWASVAAATSTTAARSLDEAGAS
jgi:hypothetical protein